MKEKLTSGGGYYRVEWVDVAKYICIIFVMLSHLESATDILRVFYNPFFLFYSSFVQVMYINIIKILKNFYIKNLGDCSYHG